MIGEVDFSSALTTVHPKAIYLHQGQQYHVEHLDFDRRKAYVKPVNVDYYTDAIRYTQVRVLEIAEEDRILTAAVPISVSPTNPSFRAEGPDGLASPDEVRSGPAARNLSSIARSASRAHGDVLVRSQVIGFKKIKFFTNENVGDGKLELPENEMHTTAFWITLDRELLEALPFPLSDKPKRNFRFALRPGIDGCAAPDVRPPRSWHCRRRTSTQRRN